MKNAEGNPLLCDYKTGICEMPNAAKGEKEIKNSPQLKPVQILYFTDPICSSCWGIEPQLRKLKLEYGNYLNIEYHMGGLLPSWTEFNGGGISKPSDVAHHWDEVSKYYEMPIDGDVWLEDPLDSSYPPSIAFIAAQIQDKYKAQLFLRRIKEMVFLEKKNITKWEHLVQAGNEAELDIAKFKQDYEGKAKQLFLADLNFSRNRGVRGFPTLLFSNNENKQEIIYGFKPYDHFENVILKLYPEAKKDIVNNSAKNIFSPYSTLTTKEFSVITNRTKEESEKILNDLVLKGEVKKMTTKNGAFWILVNKN